MKLKQILFAVLLSCSMLFSITINELKKIEGINPTPTELNNYILTKSKETNIPPIIVKAILLKEGSPNHKWKQYSPEYGYNHDTIVYHNDYSDSYGLGLFQITRHLNSADRSEVISIVRDWKINVDKAYKTLQDKWNKNINGMSGDDINPLIIENWYYPIAWYNGPGIYAKNYVDYVYNYIRDSYKVEEALSGSDNYSDILSKYKFIPELSSPYIIDSFNINSISTSPRGNAVYTLKQIVESGGKLHIWNKVSNSYKDYSLRNSNIGNDVGFNNYKAGINYFKNDTNRNLKLINTIFKKSYTSYTGKDPGHITGEFLEIYKNPHNQERYNHKGVDIRATNPKKIYSPIEGKVIATGGTWGKVVIYNKKYDFSFNFQHLSEINVSENQNIHIGDYIGKTGKTGAEAAHLHIGLRKGKNTSLAPLNTLKTTSYDPRIIVDFMKTETNSNGSIIDGAGSIIKADKNGYGLDKDIASMHAHSPYNSTVVFQWKNGYSSCSQLDIKTLKENANGYYIAGDNLGKAIVTVRGWDSAFPNTQNDEIFEVNLDKEPFSIEKASGGNGWTLISITTKNPISNEPKNGHYIYATCSKDNFKYKNRKTLYYDDANKDDNKLVYLTNGYWWAGNGSLISYLKTKYNYKGYGSDKDSAITYSSHKSINLFQWYVSDKCKKLKIGVQKDWKVSNENISTNGINIKPWDSKNWYNKNYCNGKLPCTVDGLNNGYYIIKVKTNANAVSKHDDNKGHIMAQCIE